MSLFKQSKISAHLRVSSDDNISSSEPNVSNRLLLLLLKEFSLTVPMTKHQQKNTRKISICDLTDIIVVCLFVLFLLAIVSSVLLRFTDSDYPFGIFKLFFRKD